jgi:hypothetical protein
MKSSSFDYVYLVDPEKVRRAWSYSKFFIGISIFSPLSLETTQKSKGACLVYSDYLSLFINHYLFSSVSKTTDKLH